MLLLMHTWKANWTMIPMYAAVIMSMKQGTVVELMDAEAIAVMNESCKEGAVANYVTAPSALCRAEVRSIKLVSASLPHCLQTR